jgi:hypothetical protein
LGLKSSGFPHWHSILLDHKLRETRNAKGEKGDKNEVTTRDAICVGAVQMSGGGTVLQSEPGEPTVSAQVCLYGTPLIARNPIRLGRLGDDIVEAVQSRKPASILADREQTSHVFHPFSSKVRNQSLTH